MERYGDDFCMFAQDCIVFTGDPEDWISPHKLRLEYEKWQKLDINRPRIHEIMLRELMTKYHVEPVIKRIGRDSMIKWYGCKLN